MVKWILDNKNKLYYDSTGSRHKVEIKYKTTSEIDFIDISIATREELLEFVKICIEYGNIKD